MKHIKRPITIIILLLLVCGGLIAVILRQRDDLERFTQYGESDKHNNLASAALALDDAQRNVPGLASELKSPDDLSRDLDRAVAYLERADIHMGAYEAVRRRSDEPPIILFDRIVFQEYKSALYTIISDLRRYNAVTAEQRAILAAVDHDLGVLYDVTFDHVILVQDAAGQQNGRLNDQSLPRLADSLLAITPTLKVNGVRQRLGLFPSILPQENRGSGANQLSLMLRASTTCAEVGQPVTFTLELERHEPAAPPISLESLDIVISGNGREERWSASGGAPKPGAPALASGESRTFEWVWAASEQFRATTVLVEARATLPESDPRPTPDLNGVSQDNPIIVDLTLGVGSLTQTWEERMTGRNGASVYNAPPRTLPCAQMVR